MTFMQFVSIIRARWWLALLVLGFVVPDQEIYASLYAAQDEINAATDRIAKEMLVSVIAFLFVVLVVSVAISRRFTSGLVILADAADDPKAAPPRGLALREDVPGAVRKVPLPPMRKEASKPSSS